MELGKAVEISSDQGLNEDDKMRSFKVCFDMIIRSW